MGKITELSRGSLNGLRRQTNECLKNEDNKGYEDGKKESREVEAVNVEDTSDYQIGYKVGYEDGKKQAISEIPEVANKENEMYNKGLENAWEMVRALYNTVYDEKEDLYGYSLTSDIVEILDVHKAFEIYKKYEQAKQEVAEQAEEEIKVGDEVKALDTDNIGVVMAIGNLVVYITNNGVYTNSLGSLEKTGRHFNEVGQLLDKLKGDK